MAELSLKIKADFDEASRQFKALAAESEEARAKIEKFTENFNEKQIDKFIDKQKLAGAAITATKGDIAGLEAQHAAYGREIERLIKSGLSPESDAVKKLQAEYTNLGKTLDEAKEKKKLAADGMKMIENAAKAGAAALAALGAATAAAVQATAAAGDAAAKTARKIGMTAETWQELEFAAGQSGVSSDTLKGSLEKLNKTVADVKNGSGALSKQLKDSNPALLEQLKNVKSNEEAFNLLMGAIKGCPNEFERAALAQAAFGKSGQDLILIAENGAEGIADLREEARKYGVISNETAEQSEKFMDAQTRLKTALKGARNEMVSGLIPTVTSVINNIANFISNIDNLKEKLQTLGIILAGVTVAITAFLVIGNMTKIIGGITTAFKALNAAMKLNPFASWAAVIILVITALILLYKNWDMVSTYIQQGIGRIEYAFKWLGSQIKEKFITAINGIKIAFMSVVDTVQTNLLGVIGRFLDAMGKMPFVGEQFQAASNAVRGFSENITASIEVVKQESRELMQAAKDEQDATQRTLDAKLSAIDTEANARREALRQRQAEDAVAQEEAAAEAYAAEEELQAIKTEALIKGEEERNAILEQSVENEKSLSEAKIDIKRKEVEAIGGLLGELSNLIMAFSGENRAQVIVARALAATQAGINSYLAFTQTLADATIPSSIIRGIKAAAVLASGLVAQANIWKTPIPTAETGGSFIVPNLSPRVDSGYMRVNPGERVNVTPRGMSGDGQIIHQTFRMENQTIFDIVNKGLRSGDIYEYSPAWNLT